MVNVTELSQAASSRSIIWGGLTARCSDCGWTRVYEPGSSVHRLPAGDLSDTIKGEFQTHQCEAFAPKKPN